MKSMTGYASVEKIEIKTFNNRYLDFKFKSSSEYASLEPLVIKEVKKIFSRGTIEISLFEKKEFPSLDKKFAQYCYNHLKLLKKTFSIKGEIHINHLLSLMNMWSQKGTRDSGAQHWKIIQPLLKECLKKVEHMRIKEGLELKKGILHDLHLLESEIQELMGIKEKLNLNYEEKLKEKIAKFLKDTSLDESRLHQEIAYLIERSDVAEELTRLKSHVQQFQTFANQKGSVGKSLDFLIQEMNREVNTIGSKIHDVSVSQKVILCKSLLEKMREQVQNVE